MNLIINYKKIKINKILINIKYNIFSLYISNYDNKIKSKYKY